MDKKIILQKWKKTVESELQMGIVYYSLLSVVRELNLTTREVELLSFISYRGTISSLSSKEEFSRRFSSSVDSVNNLISKLKGLNYLIKEGSKIFVNPKIDFDFNSDIVINITLNGPEEQDN